MFSVKKAADLNVKAVLWELSEVKDLIEGLAPDRTLKDKYSEGYGDAVAEILVLLESRICDYKDGDL